MTRRSGLTLVEVLTALFILALGVIAILTMFPLGASQMAIAVRDNRSTECAFNADAYLRNYWKTQVVEAGGGGEPFYASLFDPDPTAGAGAFPHGVTATGTDMSLPVIIDPMGSVARLNTDPSMYWVGDGGATNIPRRNLALLGSSPQLAQRTCTLMDTLGYDEFGVPTDDREMRYNWLWVVQLPNCSNAKTANMTVVVFDRRAHLYAPTGSEAVYPVATVNPGTTSLVFSSAPDMKPGAWIMDATVYSAANPTVGRPGIRHANFYRVTAVDGVNVELQSPIKTPSDNNNAAYTGTFVVLRGVSGVYSRPPLTAGD